MTKITEGQGLPWPKPAHLKRLASYEKTRVMLLRHLEVKLRVRQPDAFVMATEPQIAHIVSILSGWTGLGWAGLGLVQFSENNSKLKGCAVSFMCPSGHVERGFS